MREVLGSVPDQDSIIPNTIQEMVSVCSLLRSQHEKENTGSFSNSNGIICDCLIENWIKCQI